MTSTAIAILAAGASSRFEACKHLTPINKKPMLQWLVERCQQSLADKCLVISGCHHQAMVNALPTIDFVENSQWQNGLSSSITLACKQLQQFDNLLILLGDQLAVSTSDLNRLIQSETDKAIVSAYYVDKAGVPALFKRSMYSQLSQLSGDKGAKTLINDPSLCHWLTMPNAAIDIDTQADLAKFKQHYGDCLF